jgi:uncharacterized protein (TIGR02145 family)
MKNLLSLLLLLSFTIKAQDVTIGTQNWTSKNLNVSSYRNGDTIPQVQDAKAWSKLKIGAWCYNEKDKGTTYGKLYNWYAVNDPRGLAPNGYHIPTDAEWTKLTDYLGGESLAGKKMKSRNGWVSYSSGRGHYEKTCPNCANWNSEYRDKSPCHTCKDLRSVSAYEPEKTYSGNGTNSSLFAGLPGGCRFNDGDYYAIGVYGYWWSSSEFDADCARSRSLFYEFGSVGRKFNYKPYGFSVRCLRD